MSSTKREGKERWEWEKIGKGEKGRGKGGIWTTSYTSPSSKSMYLRSCSTTALAVCLFLFPLTAMHTAPSPYSIPYQFSFFLFLSLFFLSPLTQHLLHFCKPQLLSELWLNSPSPYKIYQRQKIKGILFPEYPIYHSSHRIPPSSPLDEMSFFPAIRDCV